MIPDWIDWWPIAYGAAIGGILGALTGLAIYAIAHAL